jgi:hypothetical protein
VPDGRTRAHNERPVEQLIPAAVIGRPLQIGNSERNILAGQRPDEIRQVLAAAARRAFDLLEPSLGSYGIRA